MKNILGLKSHGRYGAWDLKKKNRKKYWNRGDNKPWRCEQHVIKYDFEDAFVLKTNQFDRK